MASLTDLRAHRRGQVADGRRRSTPRRRSSGTLAGWLSVAPALLVILGFTFYPMVQSMLLSTDHWNLLGPKTFVGADNYRTILAAGSFRDSMVNTVVFTAITMVGTYVLALATAMAANRELASARLVRTVTVLPAVIPMVVAGLVWKWMYEPDHGLVNTMAGLFGADGARWLFDNHLALPAVAVVSIWKEFGIYALILLGGLQRIPDEIYEAATIDRAGPWRQFRSITLPMLRPASAAVFLLLLFNSFKVFDQVWVMTEGGPGNATLTVVTFIYTKLLSDVGVASAASVVLFAVLLALTVLRHWTTRKES
ncbi:carbohydrate ABC transporter permease [Kitasatospora cineracea]|uniref:Multiple sugar transport system permease protein n=1 Tax=Kitasatospora cineracea TaxID=88074 RepID=A0A8G1URE1_9ACTN|nr:sugar ABC transporter permease [Kitasatospora cineracea]ROR46434.1 multiple sugar transport system permease protein [Kitasatospora cineracea]